MSVELAAFAKKKMTPDEAALLQELTKPGAKIEVAVSGDVSLKDWNKTTSVVCRGLLRAQLQEQALLPVLGRLLVIARDNTDIWSGYASFKQVLTDHVRKEFGIGTSSAYYAMQMADRLPHLKISQVEAIPRRNMEIALQTIARGDEKKPYAAKILEKASTATEKELRAFCETQTNIPPSATVGAFVKIGCSLEKKLLIETFLSNPDYQSYCGTANQADMLIRAIEEATTEWITQNTEESPE